MGPAVTHGFWLTPLRPQSLSNLLWAYASYGMAPQGLMAAAASLLQARAATMYPNHMAACLWALATTGEAGAHWMEPSHMALPHCATAQPPD